VGVFGMKFSYTDDGKTMEVEGENLGFIHLSKITCHYTPLSNMDK
jgi:hypothetical protein